MCIVVYFHTSVRTTYYSKLCLSTSCWQLCFSNLSPQRVWLYSKTKMESPRVGLVRESMLHRPLLIKPTLGKTKSRGLSCPGSDFVYGTATIVQDGGVPEAISSWQTHTMSTRHRTVERDFIALNREGVKSGLVTAKELHQYRATHDIRRQPATKEGFRRSAPPHVTADASFGVTNRPSTPISELMEYKYAQRWLEEQQARDRVLDAHQHKKLGRIQDTRTTLLRKSRPLPEAPSMWKLPRFQQVGPALDTFRNPEARKKAMIAQHSESASRRGILGQGTYTVD